MESLEFSFRSDDKIAYHAGIRFFRIWRVRHGASLRDNSRYGELLDHPKDALPPYCFSAPFSANA